MSILAPRWRKVLRDLWSNKTRTILVLLSIAVGVAALGMVMGAQIIVDQYLPAAFASVNPANGTVYTLNTFDEDMVEAVRHMKEVAEAEGRRIVNVRFLNKNGEWRNLQINAIPDYDKMTLNKIKPEQGEYPPPLHELLIERASLSPALGMGDVHIGDVLTIEAPNGKRRQMRIAGTVHDIAQMPAFMNGAGYGYMTFDTLAWLGEPRDFNQLMFVVAGNDLTLDHVTAVAKLIESKMESAKHQRAIHLCVPAGRASGPKFPGCVLVDPGRDRRAVAGAERLSDRQYAVGHPDPACAPDRDHEGHRRARRADHASCTLSWCCSLACWR